MNTCHDDFADTILLQPARRTRRRRRTRTAPKLRHSPRAMVLAGLLLALQGTALVLSAVRVLRLA